MPLRRHPHWNRQPVCREWESWLVPRSNSAAANSPHLLLHSSPSLIFNLASPWPLRHILHHAFNGTAGDLTADRGATDFVGKSGWRFEVKVPGSEESYHPEPFIGLRA